MNLYEKRKDGVITQVLCAKIFSEIEKFATSDQIGATSEEVEIFLQHIKNNLHQFDFINLNPRKSNGSGGSIHVHYSIPVLLEAKQIQPIRMRFVHGLIGRHNEFYSVYGVHALDQLYPRNSSVMKSMFDFLFKHKTIVYENELDQRFTLVFEK